MKRKQRRNMKLELADASITRCKWCGAHAWKAVHCDSCDENGYPVIDDLGAA